MINKICILSFGLQNYKKYHTLTSHFLPLTFFLEIINIKNETLVTVFLLLFVFLHLKMKHMMSDLELEERVQRAVDNFMAGYGCCQSVVAAFADLYGLDDTLAKKVAAGFGGGVGRMRMMCGAASGIVMLVGLDCGQTEGSDREGKSACYKVVQELLAKSKEENGSLICAEILGLKGYEKATSSYQASARTAEYYKTRPCADKVERAARIFANYLKNKE